MFPSCRPQQGARSSTTKESTIPVSQNILSRHPVWLFARAGDGNVDHRHTANSSGDSADAVPVESRALRALTDATSLILEISRSESCGWTTARPRATSPVLSTAPRLAQRAERGTTMTPTLRPSRAPASIPLARCRQAGDRRVPFAPSWKRWI